LLFILLKLSTSWPTSYYIVINSNTAYWIKMTRKCRYMFLFLNIIYDNRTICISTNQVLIILIKIKIYPLISVWESLIRKPNKRLSWKSYVPLVNNVFFSLRSEKIAPISRKLNLCDTIFGKIRNLVKNLFKYPSVHKIDWAIVWA